MLIVRLVRFLCGYVRFRGDGGFPERFLNLCVHGHIQLWNLKNHGECFTGCTTIRGYHRLRAVAKKSGVRMHITEKCGLPFYSKSAKKRIGLLVGLLVAILTVACLSMQIWSIEVVGNTSLEPAQIEQWMASAGLYIGARRRSLDCAALTDSLMEQTDALSWAAVNLDSCKAVIEVRERIEKPQILDTKTPSNVVAAEDGVITRTQVLSGVPVLPVGSAVLQGDLLISGVRTNQDGSESLKGAQGSVYARVNREWTAKVPADALFRCLSATEHKQLFFFGLLVPLQLRAVEEGYTECRFLSNGTTQLPVGLYTARRMQFADTAAVLDETDRALYAAAVFAAQYKAIFQEGRILEEHWQWQGTKEDPEMHGTVVLEKDISRNQPIFVQKTSD